MQMEELGEALAVGIFGSVARCEAAERSDIDVLVVLDDGKTDPNEDFLWDQRVRRRLSPLGRDVTVIVYNEAGLRKICNWYVLRLAREARLIYDPAGRIAALFKKIINAALNAGLREVEMAGSMVWTKPDARVGEVWEVEVRD